MARTTQVRRNLVELLFFLKEGYAYELYQHYVQVYPKVTRRLIYYHLAKGVLSGEFVETARRREEGEYTWGTSAEKIYYGLGPEAKPFGDPRIQRYMEEMISRAYEARTKQKKETAEVKLNPSP